MSLEAAREKILAQVRGNFDAFLAARKPGQPWLYWFGPTTTHRTWIKGSGKKLWGIEPDSLRGRMPRFLPDVPEVREDLADYLGEAQAYDRYLGALLQRLEETGELERTLVVVSGDHGMPGVPTAGELETNTRIAFPDLDASPTKVWLVEHRADANLRRYYEHAFAKRPGEELYDLRTDPAQTNNVAATAAYLAHKNEMSQRLLRILADTGDPRVTGDGLKFDRPPFTDPEPTGQRQVPANAGRPQ
jgi:arylsulfatase A-like enzyme